MPSAENVVLRPYTSALVEPLYEAIVESTAKLMPFMPWCHHNYQIEEARRFVMRSIEQFRSRTSFEFAIVSKEGAFLGGCGVNHVDTMNLRANLGYWVRTSATGSGVGTAAVAQLSGWTWTNTDINRLEIVVAVENMASRRVAEKAGASFEGIARRRLMLHNQAHDAYIYSLIRPAS